MTKTIFPPTFQLRQRVSVKSRFWHRLRVFHVNIKLLLHFQDYFSLTGQYLPIFVQKGTINFPGGNPPPLPVNFPFIYLWEINVIFLHSYFLQRIFLAMKSAQISLLDQKQGQKVDRTKMSLGPLGVNP